MKKPTLYTLQFTNPNYHEVTYPRVPEAAAIISSLSLFINSFLKGLQQKLSQLNSTKPKTTLILEISQSFCCRSATEQEASVPLFTAKVTTSIQEQCSSVQAPNVSDSSGAGTPMLPHYSKKKKKAATCHKRIANPSEGGGIRHLQHNLAKNSFIHVGWDFLVLFFQRQTERAQFTA